MALTLNFRAWAAPRRASGRGSSETFILNHRRRFQLAFRTAIMAGFCLLELARL
jgi:hypothetical protein